MEKEINKSIQFLFKEIKRLENKIRNNKISKEETETLNKLKNFLKIKNDKYN
tara:strand:+ start:468 stop:623 length:156 start_codon:yes stop_codon:yes gene_type:complete